MYKSKFNILFEEIINSLITNNETKYFETVREAQDFLNKNFNGHGTIFDKNGESIQHCRCMREAHIGLNIPRVVVNTTIEEWENEIETDIDKITKDHFNNKHDDEYKI